MTRILFDKYFGRGQKPL